MGKVDVLKETTPLSSEDCFLVMQRPKSGFNFPLHVHMEFELNYLENAAGAIRIVGDSVEEIDDLDLVLIAGGTKHAYSNHKCPCNGGSPDKPGGLSIQLCKSEKKEFYIRYSS